MFGYILEIGEIVYRFMKYKMLNIGFVYLDLFRCVFIIYIIFKLDKMEFW